MGRKVRISKGKQMKPNFFIFCEGETEIAYVKFLRSLYRVPIQVIPKKGKSNISEDYIERSKNEYVKTGQDKVCKLTQAAESVRMTLRDHIILADEQYFSFAENKKL